MGSSVQLRPAVADLAFQFYDRGIHPEFIDTVVQRAFERDQFQVQIWLTPSGHFLEWRLGKVTLTEALIEQNQPMPEHRLVFSHRIAGERTENFTAVGVAYQTCFQSERLPPVLFQRQSDELRHDAESAGLLLLFQPNDRLGLAPLSYVDLQARPGSLLVNMFHTYPDEYAIVKSQTLIDYRSK